MIKVWDLDTVNTLKPKKFKSQKLHSIADTTEIFIQTPKDHLLQGFPHKKINRFRT